MKRWVSLELRGFRAEWNFGRFLGVRGFAWIFAQPNLQALLIPANKKKIYFPTNILRVEVKSAAVSVQK